MAGNEEQDEVNDSHSSAEISGSIQDRLIYALAVVHILRKTIHQSPLRTSIFSRHEIMRNWMVQLN